MALPLSSPVAGFGLLAPLQLIAFRESGSADLGFNLTTCPLWQRRSSRELSRSGFC
jgi:hypothetical protein